MNRRNFLAFLGLAFISRKLPIEKAPPQINVGEPLTATEVLAREAEVVYPTFQEFALGFTISRELIEDDLYDDTYKKLLTKVKHEYRYDTDSYYTIFEPIAPAQPD